MLLLNKKKSKNKTIYENKVYKIVKVYKRSVKIVDDEGRTYIRNKAHIKKYRRSKIYLKNNRNNNEEDKFKKDDDDIEVEDSLSNSVEDNRRNFVNVDVEDEEDEGVDDVERRPVINEELIRRTSTRTRQKPVRYSEYILNLNGRKETR